MVVDYVAINTDRHRTLARRDSRPVLACQQTLLDGRVTLAAGGRDIGPAHWRATVAWSQHLMRFAMTILAFDYRRHASLAGIIARVAGGFLHMALRAGYRPPLGRALDRDMTVHAG